MELKIDSLPSQPSSFIQLASPSSSSSSQMPPLSPLSLSLSSSCQFATSFSLSSQNTFPRDNLYESNVIKKRKTPSEETKTIKIQNNKKSKQEITIEEKINNIINSFSEILQSISKSTKSLSSWIDSLVDLIKKEGFNAPFIILNFDVIRDTEWLMTLQKTENLEPPRMYLNIKGNSKGCKVSAFNKVKWSELSHYIYNLQCDRGCTFNAQIMDIFKEDPNIKDFSTFHPINKPKIKNFDQNISSYFANIEKMGVVYPVPENLSKWLEKHPKLQELTLLLQAKPAMIQVPNYLFNILRCLGQSRRPINCLNLKTFDSTLLLSSPSTSLPKIHLKQLSVLPAKLTTKEISDLLTSPSPLPSSLSLDTLTSLLGFFEPETLECLTIQLPFQVSCYGFLDYLRDNKLHRLRSVDIGFSDVTFEILYKILLTEMTATKMTATTKSALNISFLKSLWNSYQKTIKNKFQEKTNFVSFYTGIKCLLLNINNFRSCLDFSLPLIFKYLI